MSTLPTAPRRSLNPLAVVLGLSALFFVIFLVVSGLFFYSGGSDRKHAALFSGDAIGIVEVNGVIMDSRKTLRRLQILEEQDDVKGVVLRLNSPGGSVAPSQEIYEAVKKFKKPLVASMSSVAASGGFYIACGAKKVYANPGTITGSIGVIMEFANLEKLYEWAKIRRYAIKTGKFKDTGAEYREMNPEERALLQGMVDDVLLQFKQAVVDGRKLTMDQVSAIADGRILSGTQAKKAKLVDELGGLQDAIDDVAKLAKIKGKPRVLYRDKSKGMILDYVLPDRESEESSESQVSGLSALVNQVLGKPLGGLHSLEEQVLGLSPGIYWLWSGYR